jgi:crotonobetainyl-CoA:carnitine CoA-transferase CaiB-like acyl-CoA transferase
MLTDEDADHLVTQRPAIGDGPAGMYLVAGVCAALLNARSTGQGAVVDSSLLAAGVWTLGPDLAYTSLTGKIRPHRRVDPAVTSPLVMQYRTADHRWLSLSMTNQERYYALTCHLLGLDDLVERYPVDVRERNEWGDAAARFSDAIASRTAPELDALLGAAGCVYSIVATPADVLVDEAVVDNGYLMEHPDHPPLRLAAAPVQFNDEFPSIRRGGPMLGEQSREILNDLGYDNTAITNLIETGVVGTSP